jgi:hypothetical protein
MSFWQTSVGGVPVLGSIINGAKCATNLGKAAIDGVTGENESAKDHLADAALDGAKAIPFLGTGISAYEFMHDMHAGRPTEEHLFDPSAPARQQTLAEEGRDWMFGPRGPNTKTIPAEYTGEPAPPQLGPGEEGGGGARPY